MEDTSFAPHRKTTPKQRSAPPAEKEREHHFPPKKKGPAFYGQNGGFFGKGRIEQGKNRLLLRLGGNGK